MIQPENYFLVFAFKYINWFSIIDAFYKQDFFGIGFLTFYSHITASKIVFILILCTVLH